MNLFKKHNLEGYISGRGIEIGALDNPLKVKRRATQVLYVDMTDREGLIRQNPETPAGKIKQPDIIASAEDLGPIQTGSMDFVIACHVLEHLPNPLKALKEIYRVLKSGGIFYLSVPDKRYIFDSERPVTPLSHVRKDYEEGARAETCIDHYQDWIDYVESRRDKPVARTIEEAQQYRIHFHVWVPASIPELLEFTAKNLCAPFSLVDYYYRDGDAEVVYISRKSEHPSARFTYPMVERYSLIRAMIHRRRGPVKMIFSEMLRRFSGSRGEKHGFTRTNRV